jgi:rhodanese-related sulfurtransferase
MSTTLTRESVDAVSYFKAKLEFEVGPFGVDQLIKDKTAVKIIDLRIPEAYAKSHIPGALNISYEELPKQLSQLHKDELTVVYCYNITCHLAAKAALYLAEQGYKVKELAGGFDDYVQRGLKVEGKAEASACSTKHSTCA